MQIQKGLVKYKDRSDIVCTYGLTEDGKQYYFLDNTSMSNGNIIATTVLVEAIDPVVVASSIGVIDPNGNVVIPFENKAIKLLTNDLLLVEIANSNTPSVVEANSMRSDPLAATKLVTTAATIKDNMNAKMGSEGRFVFNDQFSEATIYDINGTNIIDNQYFSFIAIKNNETLYFSKNTADFNVLEYSLTDRMFIAPPQELPPLDVQATDVSQEMIDGAMQPATPPTAGFDVADITAKDFEAVAVEEPMPITPEIGVPSETPVAPLTSLSEETLGDEIVEDEEVIESVIPVDVSQTDNNEVEEQAVSDEVQEVDDPLKIEEPVADSQVEEPQEIVEPQEVVEEEKEEIDEPEPVEEEKEEENITEDLMSFDFENDENKEEPVEKVVEDFKNDLFESDTDFDIFADSKLQVDKIDLANSYNDFGYRFGNPKDTIIEDVAVTMSNLIRLNKTQKNIIASYEDKLEQAAMAYKNVVEKARVQVREVDSLKGKMKNYETIISKLEGKIQMLENKVHDQDRLISNQTRELETLRPQVEGKEELVKILADAQNLLDQTI